MTQITDNAEGKLELWFFRDMNDAQRLKLFSLFGLPTDEINTLGTQKLVLRRILAALTSTGNGDRQAISCAARRQSTAGGNDPADCDWPFCGCDPHADKVIAAIEESGRFAPRKCHDCDGLPGSCHMNCGPAVECAR